MSLDVRAHVRSVFFVTAIIAALYHVYLIIHPHTPISEQYRIGILDLTQLMRATHVFFIVFLGYLLYFIKGEGHLELGLRWTASLALILLSYVPTYHVASSLGEKGSLDLAVYVLFVWLLAIAMPPLSVINRTVRLISDYTNLLLALMAIPPYLYLVLNYEQLIYRIVNVHPLDLAMGWSIVLLLFGVVLRLIGPELPLLVNVFIVYNLYGYLLPRPWRHPGFDIDLLVAKTYSETEGALFGIITNVSLTYIAYFALLTGILTILGYGDLMARAFFALLGRHPASPGRVSVGLGLGMGMVSGSGAADTAFVASTMKPIFKRAGYPDLVAAGIAANAGTLAIVTPPILGAAAFVMAELLAIPITHIMIMALTPAVLYAVSILLYNEFYVRGANISPMEVEERRIVERLTRPPYVRINIDYKSLVPFVPPALIVILLFSGYTVRLSATIAIIASIFLAALVSDLRKNLGRLSEGLVEGVRLLIPIGASIATANIIMAMVVISGLHSKFSQAVLSLMGENLVYTIIFAALFSLILGMGVPPTATYVLSSLLTAPAIIKLAVASGVPEEAARLATHMFLFYMAMLADVTPPVALSAFAAAAVYNLNPLRVGVKAALVALPKYLYAVSFIWSYWGTAILILPVALTADPLDAIVSYVTRLAAIILGILFISIANAGYYARGKVVPLYSKIALYVSGISLMIPVWTVNIIGMLIGALVMAFLKLKDRG